MTGRQPHDLVFGQYGVTMPHTMLSFRTVKARTGLSRSTTYLRISRGTFPTPVSLGGRAVGWIEAEVGSVLISVQNRLRETSGHGKRLIDEIDLLTKECSLIFPGESGQVDYAAHVTFRTCRLSNALGLRYPSDECSRYGL